MDVHSAKESGSQKMPGGRPRRQLFRPRHTPGKTEVGRNWPPNLLMITERGTREESAFFQPSRFHIRHQGRSLAVWKPNQQPTKNSFAFRKCEAAQKKMVAMSRYPGWNWSLCLIHFWGWMNSLFPLLALRGNKNWLPSIKVKH